jgi:hypothetical protein
MATGFVLTCPVLGLLDVMASLIPGPAWFAGGVTGLTALAGVGFLARWVFRSIAFSRSRPFRTGVGIGLLVTATLILLMLVTSMIGLVTGR